MIAKVNAANETNMFAGLMDLLIGDIEAPVAATRGQWIRRLNLRVRFVYIKAGRDSRTIRERFANRSRPCRDTKIRDTLGAHE